jgi:preprotein translocase subunit SecD
MRATVLATALVVVAAGCGGALSSVSQPGTAKLELRLIAANEADGFKVKTWDGKETMTVEKRAYLNEKDLDSVKLAKMPDGSPSINLVFDQTAALTLEDITAKNKGRRMAILVEGKIVIAPSIKERISGGHVTLAGLDAAQTQSIYDKLKKK